MPSDSDRAPDSTATVPFGNVVGSASVRVSGSGSKLSDSGSTSFDGGLAASTGTHLPGYRRHLAAQVFYLLSTVNPMPIQAHRRRHNSTFCLIRIIAHSKVCSIG